MTFIKCPRAACRYEWQARVAKPKMCPRCHARLDKPKINGQLGGRPAKVVKAS